MTTSPVKTEMHPETGMVVDDMNALHSHFDTARLRSQQIGSADSICSNME